MRSDTGINFSNYLLSYQREAAREILSFRKRFFLGIWSRQTGKSHLGGFVEMALCQKQPGYTHVIAAPSERQALAHLEKTKTWVKAFDVAVADEDTVYERDGNAESLILAKSIRLSNGSSVVAVPGKPETVRGFSGGITLDEFEFFDDQKEVWRALVPTIINPLAGFFKPILITTTPNGRDRKGYELWRDNHAAKNSKWLCSMVDIYTAAAAWKAERGIELDLNEMREMVADEDGWAQEFGCKFIDNQSVLLPYDLIATCESAEAQKDFDFSRLDGDGKFFIGVDIGRRRDLTVIYILEKVGDVFWTRGIIELAKTEFSAQKEILRSLLSRRAVVRCAIDETGIGMNLAEDLQKEFGEWRVDKCTFTAALKNRIFLRMRAAFEERILRVPICRELREDLHAMQKTTSVSGAVRFLAARNEDGHSDRATALALALAAGDEGAGSSLVSPVDVLSAGLSGNRYSGWH